MKTGISQIVTASLLILISLVVSVYLFTFFQSSLSSWNAILGVESKRAEAIRTEYLEILFTKINITNPEESKLIIVISVGTYGASIRSIYVNNTLVVDYAPPLRILGPRIEVLNITLSSTVVNALSLSNGAHYLLKITYEGGDAWSYGIVEG